MNRKMKWVIGGVAAGLLVMAIAIPALAAGPTSPGGVPTNATERSGYANCQGVGFGPDEEVAALLGLTQEQIREQRQAGKSLVQIAEAQDVSEETLVNAIMEEKQTTLQNRVAAGTLTREQADLMLVQMKERVKLAVNRTTVGPPSWAGVNSGGRTGKGMMRQDRQTCNQLDCTGVGQMMGSGRAGK
jgi:hypothetical protein